MTFPLDFTCARCQRQRTGFVSHDSLCSECHKQEDDATRARYLQRLEALPMEERLAKIEAWIYYYASRENSDSVY